mmetsp:Transcript_22058/g.54593  ORF Transcript_22058/g.54593 Transcript_22058/m.54593 type:complete len:273 (-) Transcript_22058:229-1047(-)
MVASSMRRMLSAYSFSRACCLDLGMRMMDSFLPLFTAFSTPLITDLSTVNARSLLLMMLISPSPATAYSPSSLKCSALLSPPSCSRKASCSRMSRNEPTCSCLSFSPWVISRISRSLTILSCSNAIMTRSASLRALSRSSCTVASFSPRIRTSPSTSARALSRASSMAMAASREPSSAASRVMRSRAARASTASLSIFTRDSSRRRSFSSMVRSSSLWRHLSSTSCATILVCSDASLPSSSLVCNSRSARFLSWISYPSRSRTTSSSEVDPR